MEAIPQEVYERWKQEIFWSNKGAISCFWSEYASGEHTEPLTKDVALKAAHLHYDAACFAFRKARRKRIRDYFKSQFWKVRAVNEGRNAIFFADMVWEDMNHQCELTHDELKLLRRIYALNNKKQSKKKLLEAIIIH